MLASQHTPPSSDLEWSSLLGEGNPFRVSLFAVCQRHQEKRVCSLQPPGLSEEASPTLPQELCYANNSEFLEFFLIVAINYLFKGKLNGLKLSIEQEG